MSDPAPATPVPLLAERNKKIRGCFLKANI
jgi:hypothetical protein